MAITTSPVYEKAAKNPLYKNKIYQSGQNDKHIKDADHNEYIKGDHSVGEHTNMRSATS